MNQKLTIFTPTYNRGHLLAQCYSSLCAQSNKDFEWIIIDDGSEDNTKDLVEKWIRDEKIKIKYYFQINSGKHIARNMAVEKANGELFLCLDSDDFLSNDAVEKILTFWDLNGDDKYSGLVALKAHTNGKVVGTLLPNIRESTLIELYYRYKIKGDKLVVYRTEILKKFKFPNIKGEKFLTEAYIYDQIDELYNLLILNDTIYYCEYLKDGYTRNFRNLLRNNPQGYTLFFKNRMNNKSKIPLLIRFRYAAWYTVVSWVAGNRKYIKETDNKLLVCFSMFPALLICIKHKLWKRG